MAETKLLVAGDRTRYIVWKKKPAYNVDVEARHYTISDERMVELMDQAIRDLYKELNGEN